jgi:hypothetical protein
MRGILHCLYNRGMRRAFLAALCWLALGALGAPARAEEAPARAPSKWDLFSELARDFDAAVTDVEGLYRDFGLSKAVGVLLAARKAGLTVGQVRRLMDSGASLDSIGREVGVDASELRARLDALRQRYPQVPNRDVEPNPLTLPLGAHHSTHMPHPGDPLDGARPGPFQNP